MALIVINWIFKTTGCLTTNGSFISIILKEWICQAKTLLGLHNATCNWCIATSERFGFDWVWYLSVRFLGSYDEWTTYRHGKVTNLTSPPSRIVFLLDWLQEMKCGKHSIFKCTMRLNRKAFASSKHMKVLLHSRLSIEWSQTKTGKLELHNLIQNRHLLSEKEFKISFNSFSVPHAC